MAQDLELGEDSEDPSAFAFVPTVPPTRKSSFNPQNPYQKKKKSPPPQPVAKSKEDISIADIVLQLADEHGFDGLSEEKQKLVKTTKRGKNTKETESRKASNEKRFFEELKNHGGKAFAPLLEKVPVKYNGMSTDEAALDYQFFNVLGFSRDKKAHAILNKACIVVALNLNKKKGRNNTAGQPFQPNSLEQFFRNAFLMLKQKGILKVDPKFATNTEKRRIKENVLALVCKAVREGVIKITNRYDVFEAVHFNGGLFLCFRGKQDHKNTRKENLRGVYDDDLEDEDDGNKRLGGIQWRGFFIPFSKTNQLGFGNTSLPQESERIRTMRAHPHLEYDPVEWHDTYVAHMHPDAVGFYAYPYTETESKIENARLKQRDIDWNKGHPANPRPIIDYDVWYRPSNPNISKHEGNLGHNQHCPIIQKFCTRIGVQDAEKVASGHALRAKAACTIMKGAGVDPHAVARQMGHKSIDSQKHYTETTQGMKADVYNAIAKGGRKKAVAQKESPIVLDVDTTPVSKKPRVSTLNTDERRELEEYRRQEDPERKELERLRRKSMENKENVPPVAPAPSLAGLPYNPYGILYPSGYPAYPPPGVPPYHPPFPMGQLPPPPPPRVHGVFHPPPPPPPPPREFGENNNSRRVVPPPPPPPRYPYVPPVNPPLPTRNHFEGTSEYQYSVNPPLPAMNNLEQENGLTPGDHGGQAYGWTGYSGHGGYNGDGGYGY
ncbi:unknown protein [Seminavis robusta]|uniref:Uncharacterized protein n=1 Tax=Seminavis robusta TaxID=568900 RepID=A0A9N8ESJ0_9STRA|nr:unknown protein [Seminavis robusta]|eukprot:Sro1520_g279410.1 n/a (720) ;mRNA; r:23129-25363